MTDADEGNYDLVGQPTLHLSSMKDNCVYIHSGHRNQWIQGHCISLPRHHSRREFRRLQLADQPGFPQISDGIKMLEAANKIVRHNFLGFDLKWLEKLRHARISPSRVLETLLAGRIRSADLRDAGRWAGFRT